MIHLKDFDKFSQSIGMDESIETNEGIGSFGKKVLAGAAIGASLLGNPLQSCSPGEDIESVMKERNVDPKDGFEIDGKLFLIYNNPEGKNYYINSQQTIKTNVQGNIYLQYNPKNDFIKVDGGEFKILSIDRDSVTYEDGDSTYVIEFNQGCVYDGISTKVKFNKYKSGEKYKLFDQYVF